MGSPRKNKGALPLLLCAALLFSAIARAAPALPALPAGAALHAHIPRATEAQRGAAFWGVDSAEQRYASAGELWAAKGEAQMGPSAQAFYEAREATVKGVTDLDEAGNALDLAHTASLVRRALQSSGGSDGSGGGARCLDLCAGIGRVAAGALHPAGCAVIDVLEPQAHLLAAAAAALAARGALGRAFAETAQAHAFPAAAYDVVHLGWCAQHLSDGDLAGVLRAAAGALAPGGALLWKDNVSDFADVVYGDAHHTAIRGAAYAGALVALAQPALERVAEEAVPGWPGDLFPYRAWLWVRSGEWGEVRRARFAAATAEEALQEGDL